MPGIQAGGGSAGRLGIEIVAEVARLQQDMDRVRKLVKDASGDIAKNAKAANDNLAAVGRGAGAGIQSYTRDIAALKARLDPVWAAQQRFNEQQKLGVAAFNAGAIGRQQFIEHMRQINAELKASTGLTPAVVAGARAQAAGMQQVTAMSGMQRAGMAQLAMNLSDVSTMYNLGAKTSQIFASQSGQVIQAIIMLAGTTSKFAVFMQGPWGIALTAATLILAPFVGKLFEAEEATKKTSNASETLADKLSLSKHSWEEVIEATREFNGEQVRANQTTLEAAAATAKTAAANVAEALSIRQRLAAKLEEARQATNAAGGEGFAVLMGLGRQGDIEAKIAANDKAIKDLTTGAWNAVNAVGAELGKLASDPRYAIEQRFQRARNELNGMNLSATEYAARLKVIAGQEERALDLLKEQGKERQRNAEWEKVNGREVARLLGTVPNGGGDGTRSAARNKAAGGAKNSYHLIGQAIDIPLTVNGKPLTKEGIRAALEPAGIVIKELLGPGDKGHADHFHIAFDKMRRAPDDVARAVEASRKKIADELEKATEEAKKHADELDAIFINIGISAQKMTGDWFEKMASKSNNELLGIDPAVAQASVDKLNEFYAGLERIRDLTPEIRLSETFGEAGYAIEGVIDGMGRLQRAEAEYQALRQQIADDDPKKLAKMAELETTRGKARVGATIQMLGASKRFFKEESAGYKMIMALEKALMVIEMVNTIKSIALDTTKTGSSVGNALARGAADQAAGAAKMFSFLGPFAFPVVAAMIALLAGLGLKGGSSAAPSIPSAEDLQEAAGTGSVLGDSKAKSNSIANSLEIVAANTNRDLEYSNSMLVALRSIDSGITKLSGSVAKQIQVAGGMFDTSGARLGQSGSSGFFGLFGSSTTRSLWDVGLDMASASVGSILAQGIQGSTYQIVQQVKKSNGFFGIGGGTKTTYETTTGQIDPSITAAISDVLAGLKAGLTEAAKVVGLEGADAIIDNFRVELGRISFKDMSGEEIEQQLNAIFSKVGDDMAAAILPGLKEMQLIGEGLFETFSRVAREYQVVDISLKSIGMTFGAVGVSSLAARDNLVQLFGSMDDFVSATDFYRENFLTEAEQIAPIYSSVTAEMARLGLASVDTIEEFKGVVKGLDLTTQAGRDMYAALMNVAPAFSAVEKYQDKLAKDWEDRAKSLADYRDSLLSPTGAARSYAAIAAQYRATAGAASLGDAAALDGLKSASQEFLEAAKANASSELDYARARAEVLNNLGSGIDAANSQADLARRTTAAVESMAADVAATQELTAQLTASVAALNRKVDGVIDGDAVRITNDNDTPLTASVTA